MKSEVYSWRLSPALKNVLAETARQEHATISTLLERIVAEWLTTRRAKNGTEDEVEQQRLHAAAARTFGTIHGGNQYRSEQVRQAVRSKLGARRAR
jgi:hypothetical protein